MMQLTGVVAIVFMSVAMLLALRPRALEGWFGGLDKMYRLHKWLGIGALVLSILHWMWSQAPGWAISLG
ncbi:MAG: ferric reductase-like transmembrane domain-containing protein, partial [Rhizobiales bacterium]|nr:ferric reductase-like transmembrane domain-containing protein [Hyphomicrobiales bacterium]